MSDQTTQQTPDAEQLTQLQSQVDRAGEQLATAEAQREWRCFQAISLAIVLLFLATI